MSYGIYIGKNVSQTGHAWIGGYGDEPSSHWLEVEPRRQHARDASITVGVTSEADLPGVLSEIPQVSETFRHIRTSYTHYLGVPAPLTNGGLNEFGVAVRDIWSTSRAELIAMTPADQSGPNYSDLARIVLQRAKTASDAVNLIGELIAEHGYSSYGGNSHLIADANEAWVVIECAGGQRLWAAERLGPDSIRASRPGYIEVIPVDSDSADFRYAPNLVSFAMAQGWFVEGSEFNFNTIYGDGKSRWAGVVWIEGEMRSRASEKGGVTLEDMLWAVRTPKLTGDTAGYGQVVPLIDSPYVDCRYLWHASIGAIAAPFVPVFMAMETVPEELQQHRYLSDGESARFMDNRKLVENSDSISIVSQGIESTRSACAIYKRLLYLIVQNQSLFLDDTIALWEHLEASLLAECNSQLAAAYALCDAQQEELAAHQLNYFCHNELIKALNLAEGLATAYEARTRLLRGINPESDHLSCEQLW